MTTKTKTYQGENKNRKIGIMVTLVFHIIVLLLLLFFKVLGKSEVPEPPIYGLGMVGDIDGTDDEEGGGEEIPIEEVIDNTKAGEENKEEIVTNENSDIPSENNNNNNSENNNSNNNNSNNNEPGGKKKGNGGVGDDLNLAGYEWLDEPDWQTINKDKNTEGEVGEIVFNIQVDEEGGVMRLDIQSSTVSQRLALKFRDAIIKDASFVSIGAEQGASGTIKIKLE